MPEHDSNQFPGFCPCITLETVRSSSTETWASFWRVVTCVIRWGIGRLAYHQTWPLLLSSLSKLLIALHTIRQLLFHGCNPFQHFPFFKHASETVLRLDCRHLFDTVRSKAFRVLSCAQKGPWLTVSKPMTPFLSQTEPFCHLFSLLYLWPCSAGDPDIYLNFSDS